MAEEICEHFGPRGLKLLWQDIIRRTQGTRLCLHPILEGRGISGHWRGYVGKDQDQEESSARDPGEICVESGHMWKLEVALEGPVGQVRENGF